MDTTFSIKAIFVDKLGFAEKHASWNVTVIFDVMCPFGQFQFHVPVEKVVHLDDAVLQATRKVIGWGSTFEQSFRSAGLV